MKIKVIKQAWMGLQCLDFKVLFIPSSQEQLTFTDTKI